MRVNGPARILLALGLAAMALLGLASAAEAHSGVREVVPADGSSVSVPPKQVRVVFTENVLEDTARMRVTGPQGEIPIQVDTAGPTVTGTLGQALTDGSFTVLWRVTSADGHPISGSFAFQVSGAAAAASAPSASTSEAVAPSASEAASPATSARPTTPVSDSGSTASRVLVAGGAVIAALAGIGALWARTRRQQPGAGNTP
jgi:methionine-rich copper-binding protein CopC